MAEPFLGELRLASFNFAPKGWALCNGQFMPINQNQALFSLLGTTYGGNGQTTFALPDLRGRTPVHTDFSAFQQGQKAGAEVHTLTMSEMPQHIHIMGANTANADKDSATITPGTVASFNNGYRSGTNLVAISPATLTSVGGSQAHENRQPFLVLNIIIALIGIFPTRN